MTKTRIKREPAGAPPRDLQEFERVLEAFSKAPDKYDVVLRLQVSGGLVGERYEFDLEADSRGEVKCAMSCDLTHRKVEPRQLKIEPRELAAVIRGLEPLTLMRHPPRQGGFPPDSLIGRLELRIGSDTIVTYFMADPEQAKTIGYEPPPQVVRTAEALYGLAERLLGIKNVRP